MKSAFATALLSLLLLAAPASAREETRQLDLGDVRVGELYAEPGGALWYAGRSYAQTVHDEIGRVAPTGEVTRFALPEREERFQGIGGIATSPGGSLWFTEPNYSRIGRITPAGEITEFPSPLYVSRPQQIVVGPDGNVWFTDGYRIDRYDIGSNSFEEFRIAGGADATGIVVGPDSAIWFAERGLGHIGRITTSGDYTRYEIPAVSHPREIVVGPDGNLWFTDEEAPRIGRITTGGRISLFPVPVKGGTEQISSGPHGLLWYSSGTEIGTISTSGAAAPPECLFSACLLRISALTSGSDGFPWVAGDGFVGRFVPSVRVSIGRHPSRIRGRYLNVGVRCNGGVLDLPCEGALRLNGQVPRRHGGEPMLLLLAKSRFSIPAGGNQRVTLRLRGRPFRLLAGRNRIKAWAYTTLSADPDGPLPLTLRR